LAGSLPGLFALWRTARTSTVSGVSQESLLPDVDSRALAAAGQKSLKEVGWTKGLELAKLARKQGERFESATWLHKARALPKEDSRGKWKKSWPARTASLRSWVS
jgi:hypothetical protein